MSNDLHVARQGIGCGLAIVVTGPSGAGKNSVIDAVMEQLPNLVYSVSYTSRECRDGEVYGEDYYFVSKAEFQERIDRGDFIEHVMYVGDHYGTSRSQIEAAMAAKQDVILNIEVIGARKVMRGGIGDHRVIFVFLAPSSMDVLEARLRKRNTEDENEMARRLETAREEMKALPEFDYLVLNDAFEDAVDELRAIILAERCRIHC